MFIQANDRGIEFNIRSVICLLLISLLSFINNLANARSYQLEKASLISIIGYTQILFVYLLDVFILHTYITVSGLAGAFLILASVINIIIRKSKWKSWSYSNHWTKKNKQTKKNADSQLNCSEEAMV